MNLAGGALLDIGVYALSIARSLTQLQKGEFIISIDGDLFKAQVTFPVERRERKAERIAEEIPSDSSEWEDT